MKKYIYGILLPLLSLLSSCRNELDFMADYKDITISYAILNVNDPVHYFKIYKGYQTEDNAYVQAADWNNIYYPVDSIEVRLEEYNDKGTLIRSAVLDTTTRVEKETGYFANPKQLLYYSKWKLNDQYIYRLVIKHVNSGKEIYAETNIVGDAYFTRPLDQNPFNCMKDYPPRFQLEAQEGTLRNKNVAVCDFYLVFHYVEIDNDTHEATHKTITKRMNASYVTPHSDGTLSFDDFSAQDLLNMIKGNVQPNDKVTRYIDTVDGNPYFCLELYTWFANKEFQIYHDVAAPTTSLIQDRLEYTNFVSEDKTAYGLLASRNYCRKLFKFDNTGEKHNEDSLVHGSITGMLNFKPYRESPEFWGRVTR